MEMEESSQKYLTINTHKGLYQYHGLVFGIWYFGIPVPWKYGNAPWTRCYKVSLALSYLDYIIVTGPVDDTNVTNLDVVLTRL